MEQAGLSGAGAHVHLLDAAVYGTCKEESGLPSRLRLLLSSSCPVGRSHSPQSTKRRGSARAVVAAPSARSRASGEGTMAAAAAGTTAAAAAPRCHMSAAAPPAGQLGRAPPAGPGRSHRALTGGAGGRNRPRGRGQGCRREKGGGAPHDSPCCDRGLWDSPGVVVVCWSYSPRTDGLTPSPKVLPLALPTPGLSWDSQCERQQPKDRLRYRQCHGPGSSFAAPAERG